MKVIIAGSRNIFNFDLIVMSIIESNFDISEVVSGNAKGVDSLGEKWGKENKKEIKLFPANWNLYGKSAGPRRNEEMAKYADALIAIWDGESKGTKNMIENMKNLKKPIYIKYLKGKKGNE